MLNDKAIIQYRRRHAEAEAALLDSFPNDACYEQVVVVPAHREKVEFLLDLQELAEAQGNTLVILIINRPDNQNDYQLDHMLWQRAIETGVQSWQQDGFILLGWENGSALLLLDRFSEGRSIPRKQGVGLARKIGCDIALELHARGKLTAEYIHTTDADARLPADYFQQSVGYKDCSALLYSFHHVAGDDAEINAATAVYEASLHYYVDGLRWAGSPYAFHTMGSCMALSIRHYAQARGFPKRSGGEDFYLLNKLVKLAPVQELEGEPIRLQARSSSRVPFGTGPAVSRILDLSSPAEFRVYAPEIFVELRQLLNGFDTLWESRHDHHGWLRQFSRATQNACSALSIEALFSHLRKQASNAEQYRQHLNYWFDAFRTLKFVRHLQSHCYPAVQLGVAQDRAEQIWR